MGGSSSKQTSADKKSQHYDAVFEKLPSMKGKVVLVTGCTSGTGLIAARAVAQKGGDVLLLNRPSTRAQAAEAQVKEVAAPGVKVTSIDCDLMDFDSVRSAAKKVRSKCPGGLNVLCNNAGVMALEDRATKDGYDIQMQTNHLSHFLLTKELWPLLEKKGADARVINHSSMARFGKPLEARYFGKNGGNLGGGMFRGSGMFPAWCFVGPTWARYQQTKLAAAAFTYALHEKLQAKGSPVKSLVAHPGFAATNLQATTGSTQGYPAFWLRTLHSLCMSAEDGSLPLMMCIFDEDVPSKTFYGPKGGRNGPPARMNVNLKERCLDSSGHKLLWEESEKAVGEFKL